MNVALKAVARLAGHLRRAEGSLDSKSAPALLAAFESELRPAIEPRLAANHERALVMDRMDPSAAVQLTETLTAIAQDPDKRLRYAMNTAGY